jgi:ribonucleoside-diphosphate reductase alpha chain
MVLTESPLMQNHHAFEAPIAEQIWDMKYRLKKNDGTNIDQTVEDTWMRIASALAINESDPALWADKFYKALSGWKYLPAGRITAGAGTGRAVTMFNCFVMGTIPDSMRGIFTHLGEAALTMQQGGGIGYDFSTLRPSGAEVVKLGADASGPLSFMDVWDAMCRTIMSAGSRRGAMMATMHCTHPDIEAFIEAKSDPRRLRMFNLSVLVSDDFMKAVDQGLPWRLHFENSKGVTTMEKTIDARGLWDKIMQSTYDGAEPGVIFIDRINQTNNLRYCEEIRATNPCGEQPLPPYGACLLGSVNLARLVEAAFTPEAGIDSHKLRDLVRVAIRMMDNVIDTSNFPLQAQKYEALHKRRIGLGVTGLANALMMCGIRYGSPEAVERTETWMRLIQIASYRASMEIAKEKGAFPAFKAEEYLAEGTSASTLPEDLKADIRVHGIRNSHLTSIAPTGTISLYAGNVSSGVEPAFAMGYTRKVLQKDGTRTEEWVEDYGVSKYREFWLERQKVQDLNAHGSEDLEDFDLGKHLPKSYVDAQTLTPNEHLVMQAAAQKYIDSAISKTINLPEDISFEDFKQVYVDAYKSGCKGCTTYRPNEITGSVISVEPKPQPSEAEPSNEAMVFPVDGNFAPDDIAAIKDFLTNPKIGEPLTKRPDELPAEVYKVKMGDAPTFYVTIADIEEGGFRRPYEVFINTKNPAHISSMTALTLMISAIFRRKHDSSFVVEELKSVRDPAGGGWWKGKYRHSAEAAIGQVIEDHMTKIGYGSFSAPTGGVFKGSPLQDDEVAFTARPTGPTCPECLGYNFKFESGCVACIDCGHSKCG